MRRRAALAMLGAVVSAPFAASAFPRTLAWYAAQVDGAGHEGSNEDEVLQAASIIKLLITLALIAQAHAGDFDPRGGVVVEAVDRVGGSDRFGQAVAHRSYPADELIEAMLSVSDNTAANALLRVAGMTRCNDIAYLHHLERTRIRRRFYDWDAQRRGLENVTTARESAQLLLLVASAAKERGAGAAVARLAMSALLAQEDRETIPAALPNRSSIANKTGELPGVRNDVGIVSYGHRGSYVISVMDHYGDDARSTAIEAMKHIVKTIDRKFGGRAPS